MSSFKSTWAFALVVVLIGAYTFWDYKKSLDLGPTGEHEHRVFFLKMGEVDQIRLTNGEQATLLQKKDGAWQAQEPVTDQGDASSIEGFLFQVLSQKGKVFRSPEESKDTDWAAYGLDKPQHILEIKGKGATETLQVSSKHAFDGSFYIRLKDELLLGDVGLAQLLERSPTSFRSRRIFRESGDVQNISFEKAGTSFSLNQADKGWEMRPAPGFDLDAEKIESWVEKIRNVMPTEIVSEELSDQDKRTFLLAKPAITLKVQMKSDKNPEPWILTVGQDKGGERYLYTNKRSTVYKTSSASLDPVMVEPTRFRDGRKPFQFPLEQARELEIKTKDLRQTFRKQDQNWTLAQPVPGKELNQEKLVELIQELSSLEAQEFLSSGKGFSQPQLVVKGEGGKVLLSLNWGSEYKPGSSPQGETFRYVRSNLEKSVLGLPKQKLDDLIDPGLLVEKK